MALKQVVGAAFETSLYAWQRRPAGDARHNVTAIQPIAPFALGVRFSVKSPPPRPEVCRNRLRRDFREIPARSKLSIGWSGRRDSNPRPSAPKADALPGYATPRSSDCNASRVRQAWWPSHSRNQRMRKMGARKMAASVIPIRARKTQSRQV
jgi:hypothetical protein